MGVIEYYLIFAITTGIVSCIDFLRPAINTARDLGVENPFTSSPILAYIVFFCIDTIIAPIIFLTLIIPSINSRFRETIEKEVLKED